METPRNSALETLRRPDLLLDGSHKPVIEKCFNGVNKPDKVPEAVNNITFQINGTKYSIANPGSRMSLNEWIRCGAGLKATKLMCQEGGCGCCVVALTKQDPLSKEDVTVAVNSCLFPLCAVDGFHVTTSEGIGNQKGGFHPLQKRLAEHNGSQCGFCSPGMVMSMYSFLKENPKPTKQQVEDIFDGNICRCTGYRPILDAMKSFAVDANPIDIEELRKCSGNCDGCPKKKRRLETTEEAGVQWYSVKSLPELYAIMDKHSDDRVKLIAGNTGKGIFKEEDPKDVYINISNVPELQCVRVVDGHLIVGAGLCLSTVIKVLEENNHKSSSFTPLTQHIKKIANTPVRNVGTLAGNLMLTHDHAHFPSDIMTILEATGATLIIGKSPGGLEQHTLFDFLKLEMKSKVIVGVVLPLLPEEVVVRTFKVTPRSQNAHAYVNAGFSMAVDKNTSSVISAVRIVYAGIQSYSIHATKTETFLEGKVLSDPETLKGALSLLDQEIVVDPVAAVSHGGSADYLKSLTQSLFYKFYLAALGDKAAPRLQSAASIIGRPLSFGTQSYQTNPENYPVNKPMTKIAAKLQASGEAQFTNDIPAQEGEVHGAFVISTQGNCKIDKIDPSEALKCPGVLRFISAADIPEGGKNDSKTYGSNLDEIFCTGEVLFAGQSLGLIVADTRQHAIDAAKAVTVKYKDVKPPILTLKDAIEQESFHAPHPIPCGATQHHGDPDAVLAGCHRVIEGEVYSGSQHHFHMETQTALCVPTEDFMTVYSASQGIDEVQGVVKAILNTTSNKVDVQVKRLGGGFGGKFRGSSLVAGACAVAAHALGRPVRLKMDFNANMAIVGKRACYMAKYKIGVNKEGLLQAADISFFADQGCNAVDCIFFMFPNQWGNVYYIPNWKTSFSACFTHTASSQACRGPGHIEFVFMMETMMEHVAKVLKKSPEELRSLNFCKEDQVLSTGHAPLHCNIVKVWNGGYSNLRIEPDDDEDYSRSSQMLESSEIQKRKDAIDEFNKNNRWRKRGLSMVPGRYHITSYWSSFTVMVSIFHGDGTVSVTHGGVEMGQGIHVKVAQVVAKVLGVSMDLIVVKQANTLTSPNSFVTGGSVGSEVNCKGAMECCRILNERIQPIRETMKDALWKDLINSCHQKNVDLSVQIKTLGLPKDKDYDAFGVAFTEVEVDILTGDRVLTRSDILYDCGESLNPEIDIGQVEGGFVFGLGYFLQENVYYDAKTGQEQSIGTWTYKPPTSKDIPVELNVKLLKDAPNPVGVLRSKASGEPPLTMSCSAVFAIKHAVESARAEIGQDVYFPLDQPASVEATQEKCLVNLDQFTLE